VAVESGGKWRKNARIFFLEIDAILVGIGEAALKRENLGKRGDE